MSKVLLKAVETGNVQMVRELLARGADPNSKDLRFDETALMYAGSNGRAEVVKLLLEKGADVNMNASVGGAACVKLLLEHGANVNAGNGVILVGGASLEKPDVLLLLLDKGVVLDPKASYEPALMRAANNARIENVRLLLDKGADVNARDGYNRTALMKVAERGWLEIARLFTERGADINVKTNYNETALMATTEIGSIEVARLLLDRV